MGCAYWVHVAESLRFVAGVVIALSAFSSFVAIPFAGDRDISYETALIIWGTCAALIALCTLSLVFGPTGEIVAGWCS